MEPLRQFRASCSLLFSQVPSAICPKQSVHDLYRLAIKRSNMTIRATVGYESPCARNEKVNTIRWPGGPITAFAVATTSVGLPRGHAVWLRGPQWWEALSAPSPGRCFASPLEKTHEASAAQAWSRRPRPRVSAKSAGPDDLNSGAAVLGMRKRKNGRSPSLNGLVGRAPHRQECREGWSGSTMERCGPAVEGIVLGNFRAPD